MTFLGIVLLLQACLDSLGVGLGFRGWGFEIALAYDDWEILTNTRKQKCLLVSATITTLVSPCSFREKLCPRKRKRGEREREIYIYNIVGESRKENNSGLPRTL